MWNWKKPLWRDERGSVLPIVGLAAFTLIAAAGAAIDMGRVQIVQARVQNALDAAGLAAGSAINTTDVTSEVNKYFYANFPAHYMGSNVTSLTVTASSDNNIVTLHVNGTIDMMFMKLFNIPSATFAASSQITRANKGMELVLVMDNTGSMADPAGGSVSKLQASQTAAITLLNSLYGNNNTMPNLWVGLVPFSQAVNIGTGNSSWTASNSFDWGPSPSAWYGCVDARETNSRDVTDDPPSIARFPQYYWPSDSNNTWKTTTTKKGKTTTTYASPLDETHQGPNYLCPKALTPMTASKSTVVANINAMQAQGDTIINLGMAWGWRMLSPRWRGVWPGEMSAASLPLDYNTPLMSKIVVLMTDGDNTIDNSAHGAYWYLSDGHLGTTNSSTALTQLNNRTTTVCNNMKAQGIIIYTVALGTQVSTTGQNLLKACASKPEYYFLSPTTNTLQTIFKQIGDSLANLRVSQ